MNSKIWPQEGRAKSIFQGELAKLIGEELEYKTDYILNLKKIGVTPLGEWEPEKPLTKDDFEAVLIRMARRSPVVENQEPAKILDSIGFPARDVSREGVRKVLASEAFKKTTINSKLILCQAILPLPPGYKTVLVMTKEMVVSIEVAAPAVVEEEGGGENGGKEPPPPPPPHP